MLPIGVQLASLRLPLKEALPCAARMGASAVELDARGELRPGELSQTGIRQLRKWLADHRLGVCAVSFRTRRGYDVEEDLQRRIEGTKEALRFARTLGCPVVVNHVGRIAPDDPDRQSWDRLVLALTDLGRYGNHVGAWLAMDTGSESGADMARLIATLPQGSVLVNFDPGSYIVNGFSPLDALSALGSWIGHAYAHDAVRDASRGRGLDVPVGRGTVDFPAVLARLSECGYRGFLTVGRYASSDPIKELTLAVQFLKNL